MKAMNPIKNGADLLLASNVFAHADDLKSMAESMKKLIKLEGKIIIEVQYLLNTQKTLHLITLSRAYKLLVFIYIE